MRAVNQKLPPGKRLRVLAGDPPIDWDQIKGPEDAGKFGDRDVTIASVMEKEVVSKHRKAVILFGTFHLFHGARSAVSIYEKDYPSVTLVISDLGIFGAESPTLSSSPFAAWTVPSFTRAKGTWLGGLDLSHFLPAPTMIDKDCKVHAAFPKGLQRPIEDYVDAFLYLGPGGLRLKEKMPGDVALDADYMKELERREGLSGFPSTGLGTLRDFLEQIVSSAENPFLVVPQPPDPKSRRRLKSRHFDIESYQDESLANGKRLRGVDDRRVGLVDSTKPRRPQRLRQSPEARNSAG
jgi:hypothetical protein